MENILLVGLTHTGEVRACASWGGVLAVRFAEHIRYPGPVVQVLGGTMDEHPNVALLGQAGRVYIEGDSCPALEEMTNWQGIWALTALSGMEKGWPEWEQKSVLLDLGAGGCVRAACRRTGSLTELYRYVFDQLSSWTDIVQLCGGGDPFPWSGSFAVAGLRKDGTVALPAASLRSGCGGRYLSGGASGGSDTPWATWWASGRKEPCSSAVRRVIDRAGIHLSKQCRISLRYEMTYIWEV